MMANLMHVSIAKYSFLMEVLNCTNCLLWRRIASMSLKADNYSLSVSDFAKAVVTNRSPYCTAARVTSAYCKTIKIA